MAEALMKYETIDETQISDIMAGREPQPPEDWDDTEPGETEEKLSRNPNRRNRSLPWADPPASTRQ